MKFLLPVLCCLIVNVIAQVGVKADATPPIASAQLEVQSTRKAFYPPRMTNAQIRAIASPEAGAVAYGTNLNCLCTYDGISWNFKGSSGGDGGRRTSAPGNFLMGKMNNTTIANYAQPAKLATTVNKG